MIRDTWSEIAAPLATGFAQVGEGPDPIMQLVPWIFIFMIFYFMLIRPQQTKLKQHQAMLDALKKGDEVITQGGIFGKVHGITDDFVTLEIGRDQRIKVLRSRIERLAQDKDDD